MCTHALGMWSVCCAVWCVVGTAQYPERIKLKHSISPLYSLLSCRYGEHRLLKFYLKMDIGQSSSDYEKVAKKEHLGSLGLELRKLNDRVKSILKEQHYMRENEAAFRDTSETCNAHVAYWSLGQTAILLVSGVWQIMHLKRFFEAKKLV